MNKIGYAQLLNIKREDYYIYSLLLSAPILLTLYRYFSMSSNMLIYFPWIENDLQGESYSFIYQHIGFFILVAVIPFLFVIILFPSKLSKLGLGLGDKKFALKLLVIGIPLTILIAFLGSSQSSVQSEYPLAKILLNDRSTLLVYQVCYILFYYIAWEFFFRGFLLFGLKDRFGGLNAILIQTISSCLIHIDKPVEEIIGSIVAGVIFGIIALRTGSFWYCFILHAILGICTDLFIINLIS